METDWPIENISHPDEVFWYGNSSGNYPYDLPPGLDMPNMIAIIPELWPDDYQDAYACNSTELGAAKCNKTTAHLGTFNISDGDVLFLKGLLVAHIMPSFYILVLLISMPLNTLALVTFTYWIKAKKPAVIYMSHLACVDLLFTLLLPLKIHYHLNGSDWVFGEVTCRVFSAAYYCYMYCSILLMMCMSVDRLVAVAFPVASLSWRSTRNATCICTLVWLLALAGTVPLLSVRQTFKIENVGITCHDILQHTQLYVYQFSILSCLYFFLPLVFTLASYSTIIYVLNAKPDHLATSLSSSAKRRRAVIMAIAVLTEFVACFAPTNGILLYHCVRLATGGHTEEGKYYMMAVCAGSSSVFLDPLLYYYGSSQCRQQISSVFWWRKATTLSNTRTQSKSSHLSCEYSQTRMKV
ncbi:proteinase-activated receptor 1-like [Myxocyprinus asiaticus]|uniref:proteinase-activated receptor 1-like n=1 Tax=Myxocyprinus asiaticus TaxID=70543 RepID=UPI0022236E14|nr:proteinase-activated receptor 1-like [Myxocyprinus asiaticus]XP_051533241.1 proteinase-activated receptor 1-like [Myxocyprinus asiaticus]XP_051533242.1 proteinase-activated receptor 1-like [Myxocyprinus asiaticus]